MGTKTKIDWCDSTWNPVTGCLHGCEYCYGRKIAHRFGAGWENTSIQKIHVLNESARGSREGITKFEPYPYGFEPTFHKYRLNEYKDKKGRNIFVCSMADLFGEWVPKQWLDEIYNAMYAAMQHNYLFLTKNPKRYTEYKVWIEDNFWYGTSVTNNADADRFNSLPVGCNTFVSIEPLQEDIADKHNIMFLQTNWIIVGAETGKQKTKILPKKAWIDKIVNYCKEFGTPIFMKESLRSIMGDDFIQEFPKQLKPVLTE